MEVVNAHCRKINEDDLERIMGWRMMPEITKYLNTDPVLTIEGQKKWFEKIKADEQKTLSEGRKNFYWLLEVDETPVGFVSLVDTDMISGKTHTGVYIAEKAKRSLRLIVDIQMNLYQYAFEKLGLNKVCEEVFVANKGVSRILDMCGSKREGILRSDVCKNGIYYDVEVRGVLKSEWEDIKNKMQYNYIEFDE
ncbi:MAG: GCN5-related N-acetyltransferase [Firmicutes bacterium]|nr:GCN5-related N-acetyltransferase [Bacillota bacterium]